MVDKLKESQTNAPENIPGASLNALLESLKNTDNPMQLAYLKIAELLSDYEKLDIISRLDYEDQNMIICNNIALELFLDYYSRIKVSIKLIKHDKPPYYIKKIDYTNFDKHVHKEFMEKLRNLLELKKKLTISTNGLGRREYIEILKSHNQGSPQSFMQRINPMNRL